MPDPPVVCFWKWIGWKDYELPKNRNLESVSAKNVMFFSPTPRIPTPITVLGPPKFASGKNLPGRGVHRLGAHGAATVQHFIVTGCGNVVLSIVDARMGSSNLSSPSMHLASPLMTSSAASSCRRWGCLGLRSLLPLPALPHPLNLSFEHHPAGRHRR
jgi:hypothetical protein